MQILQEIVTQLQKQRTVVLATIINRTGSAPRQAGSRMLITTDSILGSIGGGLPEAEAIAHAMRLKHAEIISFDMTPFSPDADLICGGQIEILLEKLLPTQLSLFTKALSCLEAGSFGAWLINYTNLTQIQRSFYTSVQDLPELPSKQHLPGVLMQAEQKIYYEPLVPKSHLLICGGGHVSISTSQLASQVGFEVTIVDDRPEFANAERFPWAKATHVLPNFQNLTNLCHLGAEHYIIIVTRGHIYDRECLSQILPAPVKYIGMIGSKKKRDTTYLQLMSQGFTKAALEKVHCPIGLDIGAETPEEIAIAIVAELIASRSGYA